MLFYVFQEEVVVYEISSPQGDTVTHACWSGRTTDDNTVEINDCFALHCGLRHDQEVSRQEGCVSSSVSTVELTLTKLALTMKQKSLMHSLPFGVVERFMKSA